MSQLLASTVDMSSIFQIILSLVNETYWIQTSKCLQLRTSDIKINLGIYLF